MPDIKINIQIDIQIDPDNLNTVILSRWPDEDEKSDEFKGFVAYARRAAPEPPGEPQGGPGTSTDTLTGSKPSEPGNGSESAGEGSPEVVGFSCGDCDHVPFKTAGALTAHRNKQHAD